MRWHHFHLWEFIVEAQQQRFKAGWNKVFQEIALPYIFPGNTRGKYEWRWPRSALLTSPLLAERQWVVFGTRALHTHRCEDSIPALLPPPLSNFRRLGRELKAAAAGGTPSSLKTCPSLLGEADFSRECVLWLPSHMGCISPSADLILQCNTVPTEKCFLSTQLACSAMDYNLLWAPEGEIPAWHTGYPGAIILAPLGQEYLPPSTCM